ncbi:MAG: hypothetical protein NTY19_13040 [Planctomycetota bacterium]|nr:hypothetical protein [Planctomycetota bacterium]
MWVLSFLPTVRRLLAVWIVLNLASAISHAGAGTARQQVRAGVQRYEAGDYAGAEKAFAEADVALPENHRVAYDRACTYAAQGDADKALEFFRKAALTRDPELVANCHYNLGCVMAAKATAAFGPKPEEAPPETRATGLQSLAAALGHYRDCLKIEPGHAGARHNLEVLRLWVKHIQDVWSRRDREKRRQELDLLALLQLIEGEQMRLRQTVQTTNQEPDSPRRRQAVKQTKSAQLELAEELEPLKEKLKEALQPPAQAPNATASPADKEQLDKALGALNSHANQTHSAMLKAAASLDQQDLVKAAGAQATALDQVNEIYQAVAPFQSVLQKATATEAGLVSRSQEIVAASGPDSKPEPPLDADDLSRQQTLVSGWSEILPTKAEQELKQLEAAPSAAAGAPAAKPPTPDADPQQLEKQREGLTQALKKAIELGPKIKDLTHEAADALQKNDVPAALPKQEEAWKLLQEIAQSLPPQQPPKNQDQDQEKQQQNQDKPQDQPQPTSGKDEQKTPPPSPQDPSQQQADAAIRKVRQREREHRERQKQLQGYRQGGAEVEQDW